MKFSPLNYPLQDWIKILKVTLISKIDFDSILFVGKCHLVYIGYLRIKVEI